MLWSTTLFGASFCREAGARGYAGRVVRSKTSLSRLLEIREAVNVVHSVHKGRGFSLGDSSGKTVTLRANLELDLAGPWINNALAGQVPRRSYKPEVMRVCGRKVVCNHLNAKNAMLNLHLCSVQRKHALAGKGPSQPEQQDAEADSEPPTKIQIRADLLSSGVGLDPNINQ